MRPASARCARWARCWPPPSSSTGSTATVRTTPSPDELADTLELYRWGDGYAEFPGTDLVSTDDNALVVLAALQAHNQLRPPVPDSLWLHRAKRTFEVVAESPAKADLAQRLHLATGIDRYLTFAAGSTAGSAGDDVDDRTLDPDPEAEWRRPPATNAARFRRLLQGAGAERPPHLLADLDRYLERVWREGARPRHRAVPGGRDRPIARCRRHPRSRRRRAALRPPGRPAPGLTGGFPPCFVGRTSATGPPEAMHPHPDRRVIWPVAGRNTGRTAAKPLSSTISA